MKDTAAPFGYFLVAFLFRPFKSPDDKAVKPSKPIEIHQTMNPELRTDQATKASMKSNRWLQKRVEYVRGCVPKCLARNVLSSH